MKYTSNYTLKKPDLTDIVNIDDFNTNVDKIDTELKKINDNATILSSQMEQSKQELINKINEVATTGTTVEVVQNKVEEMAEQGLIQAYTIGDNTIDPKKTTFFDINKFDNKFITTSASFPYTITSTTTANGTRVPTNVYIFNKYISNYFEENEKYYLYVDATVSNTSGRNCTVLFNLDVLNSSGGYIKTMSGATVNYSNNEKDCIFTFNKNDTDDFISYRINPQLSNITGTGTTTIIINKVVVFKCKDSEENKSYYRNIVENGNVSGNIYSLLPTIKTDNLNLTSANIIDFDEKVNYLIDNKVDLITQVLCEGDSLTFGAGATSTSNSYPSKLQLKLGSGYKVINDGIPGETSLEILGRQGSIPFIAKPFTMPDNGGEVEIVLTSCNETTVSPFVNAGGYNRGSVVIDGVNGWFYAKTGRDKPNIFHRTSEGASYSVTRPVVCLPRNIEETRNSILILWIGTNGGFTDIDDYVAQLRTAINFNGTDKFIVIGRHMNTVNSSELNRLHSEFGRKFIDIKKYLSQYGLSDGGLTPTQQDTTAMSNGNVPPQLMADGLHFTDVGYEIISTLIYKRGIELKYW